MATPSSLPARWAAEGAWRGPQDASKVTTPAEEGLCFLLLLFPFSPCLLEALGHLSLQGPPLSAGTTQTGQLKINTGVDTLPQSNVWESGEMEQKY